MSRLPAPVLDYSKHADRRGYLPRGWRWCAYLLAAVPWAAVLSVHLVYAVEWVVNGERPNMSHNGAANALEFVLYKVTRVAFSVAYVSIAASVILPATAYPALGKRIPPVLFLPVACWVAALIVLVVDPFRAMYFWLD